MRFAWSDILWLFWALPVLVGLLAFWRSQASRKLGRFADGPVASQLAATVDGVARVWRSGFRVAVLALLILAAARPQWGVGEVEVEQEGIDVVSRDSSTHSTGTGWAWCSSPELRFPSVPSPWTTPRPGSFFLRPTPP